MKGRSEGDPNAGSSEFRLARFALNQFLYEFVKRHTCRPTEQTSCFFGVSDTLGNVQRSKKRVIRIHVLLGIKAKHSEYPIDKFGE